MSAQWAEQDLPTPATDQPDTPGGGGNGGTGGIGGEGGLGIIVVLRPGGARVRLQHKHKIQLYVSDACGETCEKRKASDTHHRNFSL